MAKLVILSSRKEKQRLGNPDQVPEYPTNIPNESTLLSDLREGVGEKNKPQDEEHSTGRNWHQVWQKTNRDSGLSLQKTQSDVYKQYRRTFSRRIVSSER